MFYIGDNNRVSLMGMIGFPHTKAGRPFSSLVIAPLNFLWRLGNTRNNVEGGGGVAQEMERAGAQTTTKGNQFCGPFGMQKQKLDHQPCIWLRKISNSNAHAPSLMEVNSMYLCTRMLKITV